MEQNTRGVNRRLLWLILLSTLFGVGHHIDHVIRGNHVGWPVTPEISPFTYSLIIYPIILVGLYLTLRDRVGARYWFEAAILGLGMLTAIHFGPWAIEPPHHIIDPYESPLLGYLAFAWLLGLLGTLLITTGYAARQWRAVQATQGKGTVEARPRG